MSQMMKLVLALLLVGLASAQEQKAPEVADLEAAQLEREEGPDISDEELVASLCAANPGLSVCALEEHIREAVAELAALERELDQESGESEGDVEKRKSPFLRFGKRKSPFLRFGKRKSPFLRFGKRKSPFLRFGKRSGLESSEEDEEPMLKRKSPFLRFG